MTRSPKKQLFVERLREASFSVPCDFCGAGVGAPCTTRSGLPAHPMIHVSRRRIGMEIMRSQANSEAKEAI